MAQKFKPLRVIETLFTGGQVIRNGDYLFLNGGETLSIYHLESKALQKLETGVISCFCVSPNAEFLVVALQSLIIQIYRLEKGNEGDVELKLPLLCKFKAHEAPVLVMDFDPSSTLFATGSADSTIKVWDVQNGFATHNFKGHSGVVSAIKFHPKLLILASGSDDCKVRVWDLNSKKCLAVLDFHVSIVRGLDFHENYLFSASRDQMFTKWDLNTKKSEFSIPAYESLEACAVVTYNGTRALCTAGEAGIIKLWGLDDGELLDQQEKDKNSPHNIQGLTLWRDDLIAFTGDQNIWFFNLIDGIQRTAQIAGYSEEILDLSLVAGGTRLAVATNTEQIRVYDLKTFDCDIIYGHADIVLAIATSFDGNFLATGSKDHTAKIWQVNYDCKEKNQRIREYHTFTGHTSSVTTVAFGKCTNTWFLTGSQDRTIKCWHFDSKKLGSSRYTILGHEKDIQSIDISPNEAWFVSASLDKTAKLWKMEDGTLLGVFKGHRRGVWQAKFSPVDQIVATCSTDKTVKLWNVRDFSCIRTFEGHLNTILNVDFIRLGTQLITVGSDSLLKLWNINDGECINTFENHEDRIWALETSADNSLVYTGSSDSTICIWKDVTEEETIKQQEAELQSKLKTEDLTLYLRKKDYKNALIIAMDLDHPMKLLKIFQDVQLLQEMNSISGSVSVDQYLQDLNVDDLKKLLMYIKDWISHTRYTQIAQLVLNILLKYHYQQMVSIEFPLVDALIAYSEKHLDYCNEMLKSSYLIDYSLERLK